MPTWDSTTTPRPAPGTCRCIGNAISSGRNSGDVTLITTAANYLSIVGQAITLGLINLASHVTGRLPFANLAQIAGLSVLGVAGASTANVAAITAGSDGDVLTRITSTSLGFAPPAAGSIQTLLTADPASPADDTWWVVRSGSSPNRSIALKVRDAGVTYTIAEITL